MPGAHPLFLLLTTVACGGQQPPERGARDAPELEAAADRDVDVVPDSGAADPLDARSPDPPDGPCSCTPPDVGTGLAALSLACFCATPGRCIDYDTYRTTCSEQGIHTRIVYPDCNLEILNSRAWYEAGKSLVYNATTHELVGGSQATDGPAFSCGASRVLGFQAGVWPADTCTALRTEKLCPRDGG